MEATKTTCEKRNAYRIREIIQQAMFNKVLAGLVERHQVTTTPELRAHYSLVVSDAVSGLLKEPKIEIVLKRRRK